MSRIDRTDDLATVKDCLLEITKDHGLSSLFAGWVPALGIPISGEEVKSKIVQSHVPNEWTTRYIENEYVLRDPIVQHLQSTGTPFTWREAYSSASSPDDAKLIAGEASEFGLRDGFVVPVPIFGGPSLAFSYGGLACDLDQESAQHLAFATHFAVGHLLNLLNVDESNDRPALTVRERECLSWASDGKTDWEISVILGISKSTVTKHILSARTKLGAMSRGHAIAIGLRSKVIR